MSELDPTTRNEAYEAAIRLMNEGNDVQLCAGVVAQLLSYSDEEIGRIQEIGDYLDSLVSPEDLDPEWAIKDIRWLLERLP